MTLKITGLVCTKTPPIQETRQGGNGWTDSRMMTAWICGKMVNRQEMMVTNVAHCMDPPLSHHGKIPDAARIRDSSVNVVRGFIRYFFT